MSWLNNLFDRFDKTTISSELQKYGKWEPPSPPPGSFCMYAILQTGGKADSPSHLINESQRVLKCNTWLGQAQLFQAGATVRHCLTSFKVKIQLDHFFIGDGSYIDIHKFI